VATKALAAAEGAATGTGAPPALEVKAQAAAARILS